MNRLLQADEVPLLEPLVQSFFDEGDLSGKFDPKYAEGILKGHLKADTGFAIVTGTPIHGGICAMMYPDMATGELCCCEWFWYVQKEHRNGSVGYKLLQSFENEAMRRGAVRITMMHLIRNDHSDTQLQALYERRGYVLKEQVYTKICQQQQQQ